MTPEQRRRLGEAAKLAELRRRWAPRWHVWRSDGGKWWAVDCAGEAFEGLRRDPAFARTVGDVDSPAQLCELIERQQQLRAG